jgi:regulator of PEP synthase PpsR (kinase-PPPase family)
MNRRSTSRPARKKTSKVKSDVASAPATVHVLSDSTGNLARHMLSALLTQFPHGSVSTRYYTLLRTGHRLAGALDKIRQHPGPVCHAVVSPDHKQQIADFCQAENILQHDLTAGLNQFLSHITGAQPRRDLAWLHRIDEGYKRRIAALEFTLAHDDGLGLATLAQADIVLVGVSRTGKTPTSIYLAQQGYSVANVSLAVEVSPPAELLALPPKRAVGLVISPQQLVMIRARRAAGWRMDQTSQDNYGSPAQVTREISWARQLFGKQGWPILDVTDQAIEETAAKIIEALSLTSGPPASDARTELP